MGDGRFSSFTLDLCPAMLNLSAFLSSQGHHLCRWPCKPTNGVGKLGVVAANVDQTDTPAHLYLLVRPSSQGQC